MSAVDDVTTVTGFAAAGSMAVGIAVVLAVRWWRATHRAPTLEASDGRIHAEIAAHRAETVLKQDDATFTTVSLEAHVRALHERLTAAARDNSLTQLHPWLSDALHLRLVLERRLYGDASILQADAQTLTGVTLVSAERSDAFQCARVLLTFTRLGGEQVSHTWTLMRRVGADTVQKGLKAGACPGCGAQLELARTLRCTYCEAVVNSGLHDWVLVDVTHGAASLEGRVATVDPTGLRKADAALSAESLEDRAALSFWRWREALHSGHTALLEAVATDAFVAEARGDHAQAPMRARPRSATFRLRALLLDDAQRALVTASWAESEGDTLIAHRVVLQLSRPNTARSDAKVGLSTSRCPTCLAFIDEAQHRRCPYCDGALDVGWLLTAVLPGNQLGRLLREAQGRQ